MYSVVLMAALTSGAETPDFFRRNDCGGRRGGCHSTCYNGGGCHGGGHGCYNGGGCSGRRGLFGGGLFGRRRGGCSGYSSCCGTVYHGGCHGGGHCHGGYAHGCHGGGHHHDCHGDAHHHHHPAPGCSGGVVVPPAHPPVVEPKKDGEGTSKPPAGGKKPADGKKKGNVSAPATILVNVPQGTKLFVDGVATTSTSTSRLLVTPNLPTGQTFSYTLRAENMVDGQTVSQEQRINVQGGQQTPVSFNFSAPEGVAINQ